MGVIEVWNKKMKIPFLDIGRQNRELKDDIEKAIASIFEKNAFIGGDGVRGFEREVSSYIGVSHVVSCGNGTDALILALKAAGVGYGDEVITSPFTFFATAEAISFVGARPVFSDIRETDYLIDPDKIEERITDKTKAILPIHIFGAPCDMDKINSIAKRHGLVVIEDAAQAIGSEYKGRKAGSLGDMGCFSFYPTKNLGGCGDGGLVSTNNDDYKKLLSSLCSHGAGRIGAEAYRLINGVEPELHVDEAEAENYDPYKYYNFIIGCNSRLDAIQAAILSIKLHYLDEYNQERAEISKRYDSDLSEEVTRPVYSKDIKPCWHQYAIRTEYKNELCDYLTANGIGAGTFYPVPLHLQKAYIDLGYKKGDLPVAEMICNQTVCLPIYPGLSTDEVNSVIARVNAFFEERR